MKPPKKILPLLISSSLVLILAVFLKTASVYADLSDYLNATIRISVCGNGLVEGGEDCEGADLNHQTCESLGFGPGVLSCDIACIFDTYDCSPAPTPTPTPSSPPTPTVTPTPTSAISPTPTPGAASAASLTISDTAADLTPATSRLTTDLTSPRATPQPTLPYPLSFFDIDGNGIIAFAEITQSVAKWLDEWRNQEYDQANCDLNDDQACNLIDFSVLLYYIDRTGHD